MRTAARKLCEVALLLCVFPAVARGGPESLRWREQPSAEAEHTVLLARADVPHRFATLTAALRVSGHPGVLLVDSKPATPYLRDFLAKFETKRVVPLGFTGPEQRELQKRLGRNIDEALAWDDNWDGPAWQALVPTADTVVICPPEPQGLLLQAVCLAGRLEAPLLVADAARSGDLRHRLRSWRTTEAYIIGTPGLSLPGVRVHRLADVDAVTALTSRLSKRDKIATVVVANPFDLALGGMSTLAPWIAAQKSAPLLLTNEAGDDVDRKVAAALAEPTLRHVENVVLVGTPEALPAQKRKNPLAGKDVFIDAEPLTPDGNEPISFAVGRLFHSDPAVVPLMLARGRLLAQKPPGPSRMLVVSNPGGGLPLLETFSRHTALEFHNAGGRVDGLFGHDANRDDVRRLLPEQSVFLWEGHHSTLIRDYQVHEWSEPLAPSLVFLQSCLALTEPKAAPFLQRGAVAVIGSSTRTYSGSGGALSLSYFDALLYDKQTVGGGLRSAKNFLLAFSQLKAKRFGKTKLAGANLRSAWAFTLWGDPTLTLPLAEPGSAALAPLRHRVEGSDIVVTVPAEVHPKVVSARYEAQIWPNARLAGLVNKTAGETKRSLVPLLFFEVALPRAPVGKKPNLHTRLPDANWVFCWDARRKVGYLLVRPRAGDQDELHFHVRYTSDG